MQLAIATLAALLTTQQFPFADLSCLEPPCGKIVSKRVITRARLDEGGNDQSEPCSAEPSGLTAKFSFHSFEPLIVRRDGVELGTTPIDGVVLPVGCVELTVGVKGSPGVPYRLRSKGEAATSYQTDFESDLTNALPEVDLKGRCRNLNVDRGRELLADGELAEAGKVLSQAKGFCKETTTIILALDAYRYALTGDDLLCRRFFSRVKLLDPKFTLPVRAPTVVRTCFDEAETRYPPSAMDMQIKVISEDATHLILSVYVYDPYDLSDHLVVYFRGDDADEYATLEVPRGDRRTFTARIPKLATGKLEYYFDLVGGRIVVGSYGQPGARKAPAMH